MPDVSPSTVCREHVPSYFAIFGSDDVVVVTKEGFHVETEVGVVFDDEESGWFDRPFEGWQDGF